MAQQLSQNSPMGQQASLEMASSGKTKHIIYIICIFGGAFLVIGAITGLIIWLGRRTNKHAKCNAGIAKQGCITSSDPPKIVKATACDLNTGELTCPANSCARQGSDYNTCGPIYREGNTKKSNCKCNADRSWNCDQLCGTSKCIPFDNYPTRGTYNKFPTSCYINSSNDGYQYHCNTKSSSYISQSEAERCNQAGGTPTCVNPQQSTEANCVNKSTGEVLFGLAVSSKS